MGSVKPYAYLLVVFFLCATAFAVYLKPSDKGQEKSRPLASALSDIKGWKVSTTIPLPDRIVGMLNLDDYLFQDYTSSFGEVGLYIGYYLSMGKVGAAHDPLVCLPSQGWKVLSREKGQLSLALSGETRNISFSTMTVERNGEKEMFLYWFQAYDKAVSGTFSQKLVSLLNKVQGTGEDNAFVRLSCSLKERDEQRCMELFQDFLISFYPEFLCFIKES